ncbi:MAG: tetratricopeptide repeat protein [Bacteroidia bacterium]|nr:tetratricopeptide repeat protein [Bacteroidia bacterium]
MIKKFSKCVFLLILIHFANGNVFAQYRIEVILESAKKDIANNNYVDAIGKLNLCINVEPTNVEAYFFRAACKYSLFDNIGAEQDFTSALTKYSPYYYDAFQYRAQVRYRLGNYQGALEDVNFAIAKQSKNAKLLTERAFIRLAMSNYTGAIEDCNEALQMNILSADVYLCKAAAENALSDYKNAINDYDQAIKITPQNEDAYVRRGIVKYNMEDYQGAIRDYNYAISIDSACSFAYYNRAETQIKLNDNKAALNDYNIVLFYEPQNAYAYFNRGVLFSNMGRTLNAIEDFNKVLQINPNNIQALFNRAKLKQNAKDLKGAIQDYDKIIELYPYFMEAYFNRAQIKYDLNDKEGAKKDMETGKVMSEVFHSKNNSQLSRDSTLMVNLLHLSANFNNSPQSDLDTLNIQFQPLFYISEKRIQDKTCFIISPFLNEINEKTEKTFAFTNCEFEIIDTSLAISQNPNESWENTIQKTNIFYVKDAGQLINKIIQQDSLNPIAYFQRAIISFREIELLSEYNEGITATSSTNDADKIKEKNAWLSVMNDFNKAIQLQPAFSIAYFNRANVKCRLLDFEGALKDYETAIKIDPRFAEAHYNAGFVMYYLNLKSNACIEFSKAGELGLTASYYFIKNYCTDIPK